MALLQSNKSAPVASPAPANGTVAKAKGTPAVKPLFDQITPQVGGTLVRTRGNRLDGTPVRAWVAKAHTDRTVVRVPVAKDAAPTLVSMIRQAAAEAGHGVRFGDDKALPDGRVEISFATAVKKVRKAKTSE